MPASPSPSRASRTTFGATLLMALIITGAVLSACSSSPNSAATSGSTTTAASTNTTATSASGGGSSDSSQIQSLSSAVQTGENATFKATYTSHNVNGSSQTLTIEQKPPKSVFAVQSTSVINDGTHTYYCNGASGSMQCVSQSGIGGNPLAAMTAIFSPTTLLNEFHAAEAAAAAHTAGYSLAFSDGTYAGLTAKCVNFTHAAQTVKYCVSNSGILTYAQAAGGTFELTAFSSSPPASDFSVPAGATIVTIPNVSIPGSP